jgi:hypothetical protein
MHVLCQAHEYLLAVGTYGNVDSGKWTKVGLRRQVGLRQGQGGGRVEQQATGGAVLRYVYAGGPGRSGVFRRGLKSPLHRDTSPQIDRQAAEGQQQQCKQKTPDDHGVASLAALGAPDEVSGSGANAADWVWAAHVLESR